MENDILYNLELINQRIISACLQSNRNPDEVRLLLATKTVSADRISVAIDAGYTLIAENKTQELKEKYDDLVMVPHVNHFIGHLQTNKIKDVLKYNVSCIQSLDRWELAQKLDQRLATEGRTMDVLIQVNTSGEESKFGISPNDVETLVRQVAALPNIHIKGLMTIGLLSSQSEQVRDCFRLLKSIRQQLKRLNIPNVQMDELSMGMSNDLEIAIEEGATIVRVGTAVFGQRVYPDSYYWNEHEGK